MEHVHRVWQQRVATPADPFSSVEEINASGKKRKESFAYGAPHFVSDKNKMKT